MTILTNRAKAQCENLIKELSKSQEILETAIFNDEPEMKYLIGMGAASKPVINELMLFNALTNEREELISALLTTDILNYEKQLQIAYPVSSVNDIINVTIMWKAKALDAYVDFKKHAHATSTKNLDKLGVNETKQERKMMDEVNERARISATDDMLQRYKIYIDNYLDELLEECLGSSNELLQLYIPSLKRLVELRSSLTSLVDVPETFMYPTALTAYRIGVIVAKRHNRIKLTPLEETLYRQLHATGAL